MHSARVRFSRALIRRYATPPAMEDIQNAARARYERRAFPDAAMGMPGGMGRMGMPGMPGMGGMGGVGGMSMGYGPGGMMGGYASSRNSTFLDAMLLRANCSGCRHRCQRQCLDRQQ